MKRPDYGREWEPNRKRVKYSSSSEDPGNWTGRTENASEEEKGLQNAQRIAVTSEIMRKSRRKRRRKTCLRRGRSSSQRDRKSFRPLNINIEWERLFVTERSSEERDTSFCQARAVTTDEAGETTPLLAKSDAALLGADASGSTSGDTESPLCRRHSDSNDDSLGVHPEPERKAVKSQGSRVAADSRSVVADCLLQIIAEVRKVLLNDSSSYESEPEDDCDEYVSADEEEVLSADESEDYFSAESCDNSDCDN
jgi:hypothetical protein